MADTTHQLILGGEVSSCRPQWNLSGRAVYDDCLKLYVPLGGKAAIILNGKKTVFRNSRVYLFNGTRLESQHYTGRFDHCWIHFVPESLRLKKLFYQNFSIASWPKTALPFTDELVDGVRRLTQKKQAIIGRGKAGTIIRAAVHLADEPFLFRIQAYLARLIADRMEQQQLGLNPKEQQQMDRLLPAIRFMDEHYRNNPPVESIAAAVHMAPSHFHRLFVRHFSVTPHRYLIRKRLTEARNLLLNTRLTAKEIALSCGYENEFYFSKAFRKEYGVPPSRFRTMDFAS